MANELLRLREFIEKHYSLDELRTLCLDLGVEYENLPGPDTRQTKARELILVLGKQRQLEGLVSQLQHDRPLNIFDKDVNFDDLYADLASFAALEKPVVQRHLERIMAVQQLAFPLLFLGMAATVTILYLAFQGQLEQPPQRMTGDFRIAVAGFAEQPASANTTIGTELAEGVFLQLQKNIDEVDPGFPIAIWGPDRVGVIQGTDEMERADAAARLAEEIGANLVVYGIVDHSQATWQLLPEFYVSTAEFYEAEEITGPHNLGAALSLIRQGNVAERIGTSQDLTARTQILTQIAIGLAYYAILEYGQAYETFISATELDAWEELEGQEVVYLLAGNAAIKNEDLEVAEEHYQASLDLAPNYSRGFLGIAGVHYLRALQPAEAENDPSKIDMAELELAITNFDLAAAATNQPPLANIAEKVHFGLGQAYLAQAYATNDEQVLNQAAAEFNAVIAAYGSGENHTLRQLAAESRARLGLMYMFSDNVAKAVEEYETAVSLLYDNPERQTLYQKRVDELKAVLNDS